MKRLRRSVEEIQALCSRFRESNLTQRQFAAENGVSVGAVQQWLRRHDRKGLMRAPQFVEALSVHSTPDARECRIELPAGLSMVCGELPAPDYLAGLVHSLRRS